MKLDCVDWLQFEKVWFVQEIMKGIEELECTTVARWSWHLLGALWHVLWTIHPGVSHRTFGFRTLSKERHEFHTVHAAIEPNRTNKKYSNWKKSNVQFECFKKNLWDQVRMFYFRISSIEIPRSSNEVELLIEKHEWNKIVQLIKRNSQGDLKFCFFPTMEPVCNGPVLSGQFSESRFFAHTNAVFVTCIRRPPLLRGH